MTKTINILAVLLFVLFFINADAQNKKHCEKCRKTFQCSTGKCWNRKCVLKDNQEESKRECFKGVCESCKTKRDCSTELCINNLCVIKSVSECGASATGVPDDDGKVAGPPKPDGNECKLCHEDRKCKDGRKCWNNRCVHDTDEAKKRCFRSTCSKCKRDRDCLSRDCDGGYCVTRANKCSSLTKELEEDKNDKTKVLMDECSKCEFDGDCINGECFFGTCAKGWRSRRRCGFFHNCEPCLSDSACVTGKCTNGFCGRKPHRCTGVE